MTLYQRCHMEICSEFHQNRSNIESMGRNFTPLHRLKVWKSRPSFTKIKLIWQIFERIPIIKLFKFRKNGKVVDTTSQTYGQTDVTSTLGVVSSLRTKRLTIPMLCSTAFETEYWTYSLIIKGRIFIILLFNVH